MSESNSASSGGGRRRRRGGRNRRFQHGQGGHRGEARGGYPSERRPASQQAAKSSNPIKRLLNWLFPSKKKEEPRHASGGRTEPRFPSQRHPALRETAAAEGGSRERERSASARPLEDAPIEVTSPRLYVGNLPFEAGESDLFDLFSKVGQVKNVEIVLDRRTHESKGFGFVEMQQLESAQKAAESLNRTEFMGRTIVVNGAKVDRRRREESEAPAAAAESEGTGLSI